MMHDNKHKVFKWWAPLLKIDGDLHYRTFMAVTTDQAFDMFVHTKRKFREDLEKLNET